MVATLDIIKDFLGHTQELSNVDRNPKISSFFIKQLFDPLNFEKGSLLQHWIFWIERFPFQEDEDLPTGKLSHAYTSQMQLLD